jgi:hypothetical protein
VISPSMAIVSGLCAGEGQGWGRSMTEWEVYALRYATHERAVRDNFLMPPTDPHDASMPMDYFVWLLRTADQEIVVDTGFGVAVAQQRGRRITRGVAESLQAMGTDAGAVRDVIITHLHYDHAGNLELFPAATFHLQDREMAFATGRHMCSGCLRYAFEVEDVIAIVRAVYADRVMFHDGDDEVASGVSVHRVGGHRWASDGSGADGAWSRRARQRCKPLLREHGTREPIPGSVRRWGHGPGLAYGPALGRGCGGADRPWP